MELQHFSHDHPLAFHGSNEKAFCSGCNEVVSGPMYSCVECGYHLDKKCAEAPSQIDHPFHRKHNLELIRERDKCSCNFCNKYCKIVYNCSCGLKLHIKCALFLYEIVEKGIAELQHIVHKGRLSSLENHFEELKKAKCFACWKPLSDSIDFSLDCGFPLHRECVELPLEITQLCHPQHSLFLQFNSDDPPCAICKETQYKGFLYCCSTCKVAFHNECVSESPITKDRCHEHSFIRYSRQGSFICDACGTSIKGLSYICSTCSLTTHKNCISLPCIIKSILHHHPIFHKYFLVENECGILECVFCHEEVDKEYGSYYCSECKFVVHVKCAMGDPYWYYEIESKEDCEKLNKNWREVDPSFIIIKYIKIGENKINKEIKHFSHEHNMMLYDDVKDEKFCDACSLLIETSFYHCSECDFYLHKSCAELPKQKQLWNVLDQTCNLFSNCIFICSFCKYLHSGFVYLVMDYPYAICIKCSEASLTWTSQGHKEHQLLYYREYNGQCNACGDSIYNQRAYRCKVCNFNVHWGCSMLPQKARHKCDEHLLTLTYHEGNKYLEYHYCDNCEERRNPDIWFYHCAICDTSVHPQCVLRDYLFFKIGTTIFSEWDHPHSLVCIQKVYLYFDCSKCGQPCSDLALKCLETGCNFIIHVRCSRLTKYLFDTFYC